MASRDQGKKLVNGHQFAVQQGVNQPTTDRRPFFVKSTFHSINSQNDQRPLEIYFAYHRNNSDFFTLLYLTTFFKTSNIDRVLGPKAKLTNKKSGKAPRSKINVLFLVSRMSSLVVRVLTHIAINKKYLHAAGILEFTEQSTLLSILPSQVNTIQSII